MSNHILTTTFNFGKYRGQTLKEVYFKDPQYVDWCMANHESFCLNSKTLEYLRNIRSHFFSKEALNNSLKKLKGNSSTTNSRNNKSSNSYKKNYTSSRNSESKYDSYQSRSEYNDYNGYDDRSINDAFEGDRSLTWNCD